MTEAQKETLRFYTTNDFLLINGLLWGAPQEKLDFFMQLINRDAKQSSQIMNLSEAFSGD